MGIPVIKLNLAPPPTLWRLHHNLISWIVFAVGTMGLAISVLATIKAYQEADRAGQRTVAITEQARSAQHQQAMILNELREVNVEQELPRWRLAERILTEQAMPWSRITAELERALVQDVRIKSLQRIRSADQSVQLKVKGESRSIEAEADLVESLQKNFAFAHVILERVTEPNHLRGGLEFYYALDLNTEMPPYEALPLYGPEPGARRNPSNTAPAQQSAASPSRANPAPAQRPPAANQANQPSPGTAATSGRTLPAPRRRPNQTTESAP